MPKNRPMAVEMATTASTRSGFTENEKPIILQIRKDTLIPKIIPMIPPVKVRIDASARNWVRIEDVLAPRDFLIPISLVLSVTETVMIFITPIPPTKRDIAAIMATTDVIMLRMLLVV